MLVEGAAPLVPTTDVRVPRVAYERRLAPLPCEQQHGNPLRIIADPSLPCLMTNGSSRGPALYESKRYTAPRRFHSAAEGHGLYSGSLRASFTGSWWASGWLS